VFIFDDGKVNDKDSVYSTGIDPTRIGIGQYQQYLGQCFGPATDFERHAYNYEFKMHYRETTIDSFLWRVKERKVCEKKVDDPAAYNVGNFRWNVGNLYTSSAPANIGNRICCCAVDGMEDIACAVKSKCDVGSTLNVEDTPSSLDDCTKCDGASTVSYKPNTVVCDTCPSGKSSWQRFPFGDAESAVENRAMCLFPAEEAELGILSTISFWSFVVLGVSPFCMILLVVVCCTPRVTKCKREAAATAAGEEDQDTADADETDDAQPAPLPSVHCCFCYFFCHAIGLRVAPCCAHSNGAVDDEDHDLSCIAIAEAAQKESEGLVVRTHGGGDHHHHDDDSHLVPLCGSSTVVQETHGGVGLLFHDLVRVTRVLALQAVFLSVPLMIASYLLNDLACPEECAPTPSNWAGGISATTPLVTFFYITTTVKTITKAYTGLEGEVKQEGIVPGEHTCYKTYMECIRVDDEDGGDKRFCGTKGPMYAIEILAMISAFLPFLLFVLQAMRARVQWRNSQRSFDTVAQHTLTFRVRNVRDTAALGAAAIAEAFSTWGKVEQVVVHHAYDAQFAALSRAYAALANEPEFGSGRIRYEERFEDATTQLKERKAQLAIACEGIIAGTRGGGDAAEGGEAAAATAPPISLEDDAALDADAVPAVTSGGESNVFVSFERAVDAQNCFDVLSGDAERCAVENDNGAAPLPHNLLPNRELRLIAPAAAPADIVWDNILDGASAFTAPPDHMSCGTRCKGCVLTSLRYTAAVGLIIVTIVCLAISTTGFVAFSQLKAEADTSKCGDTTNVLAVDGVLAFRVAATAASAFADLVKYVFRQYVLAYIIGFLRPATRTGGALAKMVIVCTVELLHICLVFAVSWTLTQSKTHALYCNGRAMIGPEQMCNAFEQFTTVTRFFYFCFSSQITSAIAIVMEELFTPKIWAKRVLCACCFRGKKTPQEIRLLWRSDPPALWVLHTHIVQTVFLTLIACVAYPAASIAGLFKLTMLLFFLRIILLRVRPAPPQIGPAVYTLTKSLYVVVAMVACVFNVLFISALDGQMEEFDIDINLQTEVVLSTSSDGINLQSSTTGSGKALTLDPTGQLRNYVAADVYPYPEMMEERYLRGMPRVTVQSSMIWILATIGCALMIASCAVCSLRCSRRRARVSNKLNIVCCAIGQSTVCVGMTLLLVGPIVFLILWCKFVFGRKNDEVNEMLMRTTGEFVKAMGIVGPGVDDTAYHMNLAAILVVAYVSSILLFSYFLSKLTTHIYYIFSVSSSLEFSLAVGVCGTVATIIIRGACPIARRREMLGAVSVDRIFAARVFIMGTIVAALALIVAGTALVLPVFGQTTYSAGSRCKETGMTEDGAPCDWFRTDLPTRAYWDCSATFANLEEYNNVAEERAIRKGGLLTNFVEKITKVNAEGKGHPYRLAMLQVHPYPVIQLYGFAFALLAVLALASVIGTVVSCIVHCVAKKNAGKALKGEGEDAAGGGFELQPLGGVVMKEKSRRASLHLEDTDAIEAATSVEEALAALTPRLIENDVFTRAATAEEVATALAEVRTEKKKEEKEEEEEREGAAGADALLLGATETMHFELTALVQKLRETLKPAWQWRICTPRCLLPPDISREEAALVARDGKGVGAHTPLIKPTFSQLLRALAEEAEVEFDTIVPFALPPAQRTLSEVWRWRGGGGGGGAAALDAAEAGLAEAAAVTETWLHGRRVGAEKGNKAETREESERVGREERERRARVRRGRENRRGEGKERTEGGRKAVTSRLVIQSNPIHRPDRGESSPSTHASAHV